MPKEPQIFRELSTEKGVEIDISQLYSTTQGNLDNLSERFGISWESAYKFIGTYPNRKLTSFLVVGLGSKGETVRYFRVGGPTAAARQTFIYFDGKKVSLANIKEFTKSVSLEEVGVLSKTKEVRRVEEREKYKFGQIQEAMDYLRNKLAIKWDEPTYKKGEFSVSGRTYDNEPVEFSKWSFKVGDRIEYYFNIKQIVEEGLLTERFPSAEDIIDAIDEYKGHTERRQQFMVRQEQLRVGEPASRFGGPGFYEKYLKDLEKSGKLYHATPYENVEELERGGFSIKKTGPTYMGSLKFVSENILRVRGPRPEIIEIDVDELDSSQLRDVGREGEKVFTYHADIPSTALRRVTIPEFEV